MLLAGVAAMAVGALTGTVLAVVAGFLVAFGGRWLLQWKLEIGTTVGAWVAFATLADVLGPPVAFGLLGLLAGVPLVAAHVEPWRRSRTGAAPRWLTRAAEVGRRIRQPYRVAGRRRWWHRACQNAGLPPSRVRHVTETPTGWRLDVTTPAGVPVDLLARHGEAIATTLSARHVRITRNPENAAHATVRIVRRDPFDDTAGIPWPHRDAAALSLWLPIPLGIDENGQTVTVTLPEHTLFLSGEPGAGKTVAQQVLVAAVALSDATLTVIDGKEIDLVDWQPRCHAFAGADTAEANAALAAAAEWMTASYARLRAAGRKKVQPDDPLHVVVVDELAYYLGPRDRASKAFAATLRDLVARGRAAGVIVIAATQRPGSDLIPTSLRDLFAYRFALRCTTPQASDMALGQGWAAQGYDATTIPAAQRGVGYLLSEGDRPRRLRSFLLTDGDVASIAARAAPLRPVAPKVPVPATTGTAAAPVGENAGEAGESPSTPPTGTTGPPQVPTLPAEPRATRSGKQLAVEAELERASDDSDRAIARRLGVDHKTVGAARRRLAA